MEEEGKSVGEWLRDIDRKLDDIGKSLDAKANQTEVQLVADRIRAIELSGSPHAQSLERAMDRLKDTHAREIEKLESKIDWLKKKVYAIFGAVSAAGATYAALHNGWVK